MLPHQELTGYLMAFRMELGKGPALSQVLEEIPGVGVVNSLKLQGKEELPEENLSRSLEAHSSLPCGNVLGCRTVAQWLVTSQTQKHSILAPQSKTLIHQEP